MEFNIFSDRFYPLYNSCKFIDVSPVGPDASSVGFATINSYFHNLVGVHWLSDIIGGALLSTGVVMMYKAFIGLKTE